MSEKKVEINSKQNPNGKAVKIVESSLSNQNGNSTPPAKSPTK